MGRSCILESHPGRWMPAAVQMPACHSRRFKGERPIGAATGLQSQPPRPCANRQPPPPSPNTVRCTIAMELVQTLADLIPRPVGVSGQWVAAAAAPPQISTPALGLGVPWTYHRLGCVPWAGQVVGGPLW